MVLLSKILVPLVLILAMVLALQFVGLLDTKPPIITEVKVADITSSSATVTWVTDEPTTSQVIYGISGSHFSSTPLDRRLTVSHSVQLLDLIPGRRYSYYVISRDRAGRVATSAWSTFSTPEMVEYLTYYDAEDGFSILYPKDWKPIKAPARGVSVLFLAPMSCDGFVANVNVVREAFPIAVSVRTYCEVGKRQMQDPVQTGGIQFESTSETETIINGVPAIVCVWNATKGDKSWQITQVFLVVERTGWVITQSYSPTCFDSYKNVFDFMTSSFRVLQ